MEIRQEDLVEKPRDIPYKTYPGSRQSGHLYARGFKEEVCRKIGDDGARDNAQTQMEGVKFPREENPKDKHDEKGKKEGHDTLSGSRGARGMCRLHVIGVFGLLISLILNVQK